MLEFNLQDHKPLRDMVYEEIKERILMGKITPGTRLMEIELADSMGVSRTPIREAIRKLEKEGLVTIEARRGAYASQISSEDMVAILEVRQNMDGLAAHFAASRATPEQLELLSETFEKFNQAVIDGNTQDMIKYDTKFHKIIVDASHNKVLVQIVEKLQELVLRFRYVYYDDFRRAEKMPAEHKDILEAIQTGNGEVARSAADVHIFRLKELVMQERVTR